MNKILPIVFSTVFLLAGKIFAQNNAKYQSRPLEVTKQKTNDIDETTLRKKMKEDGLNDVVIEKLIEQRREWMKQGKNIYWTNVKDAKLPVTQAPCPDMGVENGWGAWQGKKGSAQSGGPIWTSPLGTPTAPNFVLTSGPGIDQNTPSPGNPPIPVVCPGFGNQSIRMGEICAAGCVAEQLTYPLTVTPNDTNFVYAYAIVIEDAGHSISDQPFVELCIYDQNGNPIPCGCFRYTGGPNIPGFYPVGGAGCAYGGIDQYKPWTLVGVNLSNYIGQTLNVVITNVDCAQCGHWAYSYWDFMCGTAGLSAGCVGNQSTICGPIDANIAYTYQWYHNGVPISSPQGTQQCITITAQPNDTFLVEVKQPSGCNFKIVYVPPFIQPGFTFTGACGTYTFTNTSTVSPANVSITGYTWSFPGGTPSSSTSPSPVVNYANPGTYTVALTVSISAGCTATATQTINVAPPPKAQIVPSPACQGDLVTLTDASISSAGDPIVSWNWSMPAGTPATGTGTLVTTTYNTAGNHVATLTVTTAQGCSSSTSVPVQVYAPPLANFSGGDSGCVPICVNYTDLSTSSDGNIVSWEWSFPGGVPSSSTSQNPGQVCYNTLGTYSTTLVVTTQYGCKNTITMPTVSTYPWPSADFCIAPNGPVSAADPTFKFCDLWSSDVTQWTWYFGDNDSDKVNTDPIHSYSASVTANDFYSFNVCLRVLNQYGCWDTICKRVEIIPESTFYIPNTFTPNEDLVNDVFFGKGRGIKDYSIWIFDRWGNLIWDCHHSDKNTNWDNPGQDGLPSYCKWDGKVEGGGADLNGRSNQVVQEDVYVWKVKLTDVFDKKHTYIGHVNVVR